MERIETISHSLMAKAPEKTPEMQEEIDRLKIQPKKIQILEDQRRVLEEWREKADIDSHELNRFVQGEQFEMRRIIDSFISSDPDFTEYRPYNSTRNEARAKINRLLFKSVRKFPIDYDLFKNDYWRTTNMFITLGAFQPELGTKFAGHFFLYTKTIMILGNSSHRKYIERALNMQDIGCYALTELTHGSNVQGCITTATFDEANDQFVINTPYERGMKFWIGNAAQTANMAIVFANLIVKGKDYGIHPFIVEIRDSNSHNVLPGITIGDCGDKFGLKGVDNGFLIFRNVRTPRTNLLDRITQVSSTGEVTSLISKKGQRFARQLAALSDGRVKISIAALSSTLVGTMITCRYGAVRRQFGKDKYDETSIMNYPSWQNRIFPYVAHGFMDNFGCRELNNQWRLNEHKILENDSQTREMHALISVMKAITTWDMVQSLEECRQACGGLGFSSYSRIPSMIQDLNVMVTWEGDNNVLLQQTARYLLSEYAAVASGASPSSPSTNFITTDPVSAFEIDEEDQLNDINLLEKLMTDRAVKTLQEAASKFLNEKAVTEINFEAWNKSVPFNLNQMVLSYGHLYLFRMARSSVEQCVHEKNKAFMFKLLQISTLTRIRENADQLFGFLNSNSIKMINRKLLALFEETKYNIIRAFDEIGYSDGTIRSALGASDGNVYDRLISEIMSQRNNFGRAPFWREVWAIRNSGSNQAPSSL